MASTVKNDPSDKRYFNAAALEWVLSLPFTTIEDGKRGVHASDLRMVAIAIASQSRPPTAKAYCTGGALNAVADLVGTELGIFFSSVGWISTDTAIGITQVKYCIKTLTKVGVLLPGNPRITQAWAAAEDVHPRQVPRIYELNDQLNLEAIEWLPVALDEAYKWVANKQPRVGGRGYSSWEEASDVLIPDEVREQIEARRKFEHPGAAGATAARRPAPAREKFPAFMPDAEPAADDEKVTEQERIPDAPAVHEPVTGQRRPNLTVVKNETLLEHASATEAPAEAPMEETPVSTFPDPWAGLDPEIPAPPRAKRIPGSPEALTLIDNMTGEVDKDNPRARHSPRAIALQEDLWMRLPNLPVGTSGTAALMACRGTIQGKIDAQWATAQIWEALVLLNVPAPAAPQLENALRNPNRYQQGQRAVGSSHVVRMATQGAANNSGPEDEYSHLYAPPMPPREDQ